MRIWSLIFSSLALVAAGCSHKEADIYRDPDMAIHQTATYALTPTLLGARPEERDPRVHNALMHERIGSAIRSTLAAKGYRQSSPETADFLVHFRVSVRTAERDVRGLVARRTPGGSSSNGSAPLLTVTLAERTEMTEGDLVIELMERQTGAVVYRAHAHDDDVTPWDASEFVIASTVQVLLQEL
jgi:Domain of unknown function (DUF4136)